MEKSKQIQIGLLGLVALLLVLNLTGAFDGIFGSGSDAAKDAARQNLETNVASNVTNPSTLAQPNKAEPAAPTGPTTSMSFEQTEFDYGIVDQGEKVKHVYKFKNTGSEPLIISNAKGSCGCTVPSWPKEPIPVGGTGEVEVVFDSKGKKGKQSKRVTITANTDPVQTFLTIKGEINTPDGNSPNPKPIQLQSPTQ
jgi:Protein of unknown function (DUF1573)